jgi:protein phosphatase
MKQIDIKLPKLSLVVLIGVSGAGKSSFAKKHFLPTEVISSDYCRALVSDNENDLSVTSAAFEVMHFIAAKRLEAGKLTVIDATNVQTEARKPLVALARKYHALPVAIVLDLPEKVCQMRNKDRPDRNFGRRVIRRQSSQLRRRRKALKREGFRQVWKINSEEEVNNATIERVPLWNDKTDLHGPFDIIGDIHGCHDELTALLDKLGYRVFTHIEEGPMAGPVFSHPQGRTAIFVGDLVDRGNGIVDTIRLVYNMVKGGFALCVPGNHDIKLMKKLNGKDVRIAYGLAESLQEIDALPVDVQPVFMEETKTFIRGLVSHYLLDDRKLVVAHAGLKEEMQGRGSGKVRDFCLFGESTGETDEFGLPVRYNWAAEYRGPATVVYGHTPVPSPEWLNRTINIDTGCVFGGRLTALRYPEKEMVSVNAKQVYCEPVRPLKTGADAVSPLTVQQKYDDLLEAEDVIGKRFITTRLRRNVTIREEHAMAALEVMSRFAANPKWLIYLPPTMSPTETSQQEGYLEYPEEGFAYFRSQGIPKVICQEKHMGSRAVVVICQSEEAAAKHFGVENEGIGIVYTRTGRRFFNSRKMEKELLERMANVLGASKFWDAFSTKWVCLDCELMPWSEKARDLIKSQYAAVGAAAMVSLDAAADTLKKTLGRTDLETGSLVPQESQNYEFDLPGLLGKIETRKRSVERYIEAYRRYCWPVHSVTDLKLAPFHILATQGRVHVDKSHEWHMETIAGVCAMDKELLLPTSYRIIDVADEASVGTGCKWWESLTAGGGEGMVIKPLNFVAKGRKGLVQPALKCRGREYLRIIYGPEYTAEGNLERLRSRALGTKRSLALREFALGIESLERFIRKEPLRRVHECVFGVLALESEPVDPRL